MPQMSIDFSEWTQATANLSPVQQRAFMDVLTLVKEGKSHLAYSADYRDGKPCLVNHVGHVLSVGGGDGIPSLNFRALVGAFDCVNTDLATHGVNDNDGFVSPLAAEFLLANFGELKPVVLNDVQWAEARDQVTGAAPVGFYVEPSDEEFSNYLLTMATEIEPANDESVEVERR